MIADCQQERAAGYNHPESRLSQSMAQGIAGVVELLEIQRHQRGRLLGVLGWQSVENFWDGGLDVPASRVVAIVQAQRFVTSWVVR